MFKFRIVVYSRNVQLVDDFSMNIISVKKVFCSFHVTFNHFLEKFVDSYYMGHLSPGPSRRNTLACTCIYLHIVMYYFYLLFYIVAIRTHRERNFRA